MDVKMNELMMVDGAIMVLQGSVCLLALGGIGYFVETAEERKNKKLKKQAFERKRAIIRKQIAKDRLAKQKRMRQIKAMLNDKAV